ncbi:MULTISPECIES: hypothetical protein [Microvirga]|uniref:hypothetical protein n=1 Tax=Microvirga TaxID=186650 RepID=UPI001B35C313|nr:MULTISPECIES: hypothetical protein [unclassified Microvirga]MBQ0819562.1 hypothetical protein [Microvirga sp. HBU67558]
MPFDGGAAAVVQFVTELEEQARKDGDATSKRLAERLTGLQVPTEIRRFDETFGTMSIKVAEQARYADVFIATRPYGAGGIVLLFRGSWSSPLSGPFRHFG